MNLFLNRTPRQIQNEIAARVKRLRKKNGFSQAELAKRAEISLGSLKRFEQSGLISLESLLKIAQVLERIEDFDSVFEQRETPRDIEKLFKS